MKRKMPIALTAFLSFMMIGCGDETVAVDDRHHDYRPELRIFDVVDSYGEDTAKPNYRPLAINPDVNEGVFDIFWEVNSLEDYRVSLWINDRASLTNSIRIHSEYCGEGRSCDQAGNRICQYYDNFYMSCDGGVTEAYVSPLIKGWPQKLYLLLEVCDSNSGYCEYDYYPVTLE